MPATRIEIEGKNYVLLPESDYRRLKSRVEQLPQLPSKDAQGHRPAVETGVVLIARGIMRRRLALGLEPNELAKLAGIRADSLRRLESGRIRPARRILLQVDRVLKTAEKHTKRNGSRLKSAARTRRSAA